MSRVFLKRVTSNNLSDALKLTTKVDLRELIAMVTGHEVIISETFIRPSGKIIEFFLVYHKCRMVGFFNLHYVPENMWAFHFFLDKSFQREGLGAAVVEVLRGKCGHFDYKGLRCGVDRIVISKKSRISSLRGIQAFLKP